MGLLLGDWYMGGIAGAVEVVTRQPELAALAPQQFSVCTRFAVLPVARKVALHSKHVCSVVHRAR